MNLPAQECVSYLAPARRLVDAYEAGHVSGIQLCTPILQQPQNTQHELFSRELLSFEKKHVLPTLACQQLSAQEEDCLVFHTKQSLQSLSGINQVFYSPCKLPESLEEFVA